MSEGSKGGWKLVFFRQDEVDTLRAALQYVIGRHDWALNRENNTAIDVHAHQFCKKRVEEILNYIDQVTT